MIYFLAIDRASVVEVLTIYEFTYIAQGISRKVEDYRLKYVYSQGQSRTKQVMAFIDLAGEQVTLVVWPVLRNRMVP